MAGTTSRKTEVTKLITVTLGKIQESKQAKCGLNLRKSLLVASVLHKARDVYVSEVKNRQVERISPVVSNPNKRKEDTNPSTLTKAKRRFSTHRSSSMVEAETTHDHSSQEMGCPSTTTHHTDTSADNRVGSFSQSPGDSEQKSEVSAPIFTTLSSQTVSKVGDAILIELADQSESYSAATDKENSPPSDQLTSSSTVKVETAVSPCGQCLKRRASTSDGEGEQEKNTAINGSFNNLTSTYVPKKRMRTISVDHSQPESCIEHASPCKQSKMDTTQINSLVRIFSQSFPEFTSTDSNVSSCQPSTELNTFALCRDSIVLTLAA